MRSTTKIELTFRTHDETAPFLSTLVDGFNNVDQLLLILKHPVQLVVVTRAEIAHHMLVPPEEHDRHGIEKFVHGVEFRYLVNVAEVDYREV
jgi:hypothetical protein